MVTLPRMIRPALGTATVIALILTVINILQYQNAVTTVVRDLQIKPELFTSRERSFGERSVPSSNLTIEDPQRESGPSGAGREEPQRESGPGIRRGEPQRQSSPSGVEGEEPQRESGPGIRREEPQRQSGPSGVGREKPLRKSGPGIRREEPQRESGPSGVGKEEPQRESGPSGAGREDPQRESGPGIRREEPQRESGPGIRREEPQRKSSPSGVEGEEPQRESGPGIGREDPQRESGPSGVEREDPQSESGPGIRREEPQRQSGPSEAGKEDPQRESGPSGVGREEPQRKSGPSGVGREEPQRKSGPGIRREEPQREPGPSGVGREKPQRKSGPSGVGREKPQRKSGPSGVGREEPQRKSGPGIRREEPQRKSSPSGVGREKPQRQSGPSWVGREEPQRESGPGIRREEPQRESGPSEAGKEDPQRESGPSGVGRGAPQRKSGPSEVGRGAPQREPGPSGVSRGEQREGKPSPAGRSPERPVFVGREAPDAPSGGTKGLAEGQVMRSRADHLQEVCQLPRVRQLAPTRPWTTRKHMILRPFPVCVVNKGGSIAWKSYMRELRRQVPGSKKDMKTVVARHPMSRLASAYRDKFLNGSPLRAYNETFRKITGSRQTWVERWKTYWLPALIHKGMVQASARFLQVLSEASETFHFLADHVDASGHLHVNASSTPAFAYAPEALKVALEMVRSGRGIGMYAAIEAGYQDDVQTQLQTKFSEASFTFVDFLEHVLWTWEIGLVDRHWASITELCDPCHGNYTFVLHLENPHESTYLLGLLQAQKNAVPRRHLSIGASSDQYDLRYYRDVPEDLKAKIINLYWLDFHLFGYGRPNISDATG
ncbi:uncharacterized protein [Panulirus ornatus]|uniref:uncharacterized protein n=1 Tax=Panulirus ornatus TaxID=150431 RepID=UPI003A88413D